MKCHPNTSKEEMTEKTELGRELQILHTFLPPDTSLRAGGGGFRHRSMIQ